MDTLRYFLWCLFLVFELYGCMGDKSSDYMTFDRISYVEKFPKSYCLKNGELSDLNQIGVKSLSIQDSILIVSTSDKDGYWAFFRLPDYTFLGKYLTEGKSDNELLSSPKVSDQHFIKHNGRLYAILYDFDTGKVLLMNISETIKEHQLAIHKLDCELPRVLFNCVGLDSLSFFCREVNNDHTEQSRFILENGERSVPENMRILNKASVDAGFDINILGTYCKYDPKTRRIAEAAFDLNIINLYSLDDSLCLTICTGDKMNTIKEIQNVERRKKKVMYGHLASYSNYFAALFQNDTNENIHFGKARKQTIQFFDWEGNPLIEVVLDRRINSFDIDFSRECLYTLSYEQDEIYVYDFKEVLEYLKNDGEYLL